jgi:hypothetical protein
MSQWLVTLVGTGLCFLEVGCSGMGGLRSIGIDPASVLGFWHRTGPGSPAPENDYYVQAMNAPRVGSTATAKDSGKGPGQREVEQAPAAPVIRSASESDDSPTKSRSEASESPNGDASIRVSLGSPEPLPGVARALAQPVNIASANGGARWKADSSTLDDEEVPGLSAPAAREPSPRDTRSQLAQRAPAGSGPDPDTLLAKAETKLKSLTSYQVKATRQERVGGQLQPVEDLLLSIRSEPRAVRLEWQDGPSKGREVIYSRALDPSMIFVHQPGAAIVLPSMKIPVDSPLVTRNSRHSITEAGFDTILENIHGAKGKADTRELERGELTYQGLQRPAGVDRPCHHFLRRSAAGENWNVYLDAESLLPRMVVAFDKSGDLIERYVYREIRENPVELAQATAFDPDQRWGDSKGLIYRLARAAAGSSLPSATNSTTR